MKAILLMLAVASALVAQDPALQKQKQVLFDFRVTRMSPPPKIPLATQKTLLSKVFRKFLTDENECNSEFNAGETADPLKAARAAGQIVPSFLDMATGSFTAPGQKQTAYVISVSECNASHADNFGTKRVAIFSGTQLVSDVDVDFKSSIVRKTDLNSDGIDELLMTGGDMNQGIVTEIAALIDFPRGRFHVIQDFGTVLEDACGSDERGGSSKAAVLYITDIIPGNMPKLRADNYIASCRNLKRWRFLSTGKMPD